MSKRRIAAEARNAEWLFNRERLAWETARWYCVMHAMATRSALGVGQVLFEFAYGCLKQWLGDRTAESTAKPTSITQLR